MVKLMKVETLLGSIGNEVGNEAVEELLRRTRGRIDKALKRIRRPQAAVGIVKSPLGDLLVAMSAGGVLLNSYLRGASDLEATIQKLRLAFDPVEDNGPSEKSARRFVAISPATQRRCARK